MHMRKRLLKLLLGVSITTILICSISCSEGDDGAKTDADDKTAEASQLQSVTFTKADGADWTLPENQDCITEKVCLARADTKGIFNAAQEKEYKSNSPADTEWARGATGDAKPDDYKPWIEALRGGPAASTTAERMIGQTFSLHLISDDLYFDVVFHSYGGGGPGGAISYTRTPVKK